MSPHVAHMFQNLHMAHLVYHDDIGNCLYVWDGVKTIWVLNEWGNVFDSYKLQAATPWTVPAVMQYITRVINAKRRMARGIAQGLDPDDTSRLDWKP